jgi:hypothetical protein
LLVIRSGNGGAERVRSSFTEPDTSEQRRWRIARWPQGYRENKHDAKSMTQLRLATACPCTQLTWLCTSSSISHDVYGVPSVEREPLSEGSRSTASTLPCLALGPQSCEAYQSPGACSSKGNATHGTRSPCERLPAPDRLGAQQILMPAVLPCARTWERAMCRFGLAFW